MSRLLQYTIDLCGRGAAERSGERAPEIVAQERVQDRINGAVSVAENGDQLKKDRQPGRHADDVKHNDLEQPVGQPADRAVGVRVRVRVEIRVRVSRVASR